MTVFTVISQIFIFFVFAFKPKPKKIKTLKKITDIGIIYLFPLASSEIHKVQKQKSLSIFTDNLDWICSTEHSYNCKNSYMFINSSFEQKYYSDQ